MTTELSLFPTPRSLIFHQKNSKNNTIHFNARALQCEIPLLCYQRIKKAQIRYIHEPVWATQRYKIVVEEQQILIHFSDEHAVMYAHQLIHQLVEHYNHSIPCLTVDDQPSFEKRGVLLDISRDKIPTMETLFELIDFWSQLRLNQFQLYTEHTFAYRNHEKVWTGYTPMTASEIKRIDDYCHQRGIELIANQATFGHMEKWLCHSEYHHLAEQTSGFYDQRGDFRPLAFGLNPIHPEVPAFIDGLFDELLPNFRSNTLNINFDETMDLGVQGSKEACDKDGKGKVYLDYLHKILAMAKRHGVNCQIFSDMLFRYPDLIAHLPPDIELLNWGYEEDHPYDEEHQQLAKLGYPFQVVVSTNTFASVAGRWQAAQVHMRRAAVSGYKYGASGYMISEWGDMGHAQQFSMPLPAYVFGAAMAWGETQHKNLDVTPVIARLFGESYRTLLPTLLDVQNLYLTSGVETPNCAFYGPFVFDQSSRRHIRRAIIGDKKQLEASISTLNITMLSVINEKNSLLKQELIWTLNTMIFATHLAKAYQLHQCREAEKFPPETKQHLLALLEPIEKDYIELWTKKYRIGGASQSLQRIKLISELLQIS